MRKGGRGLLRTAPKKINNAVIVISADYDRAHGFWNLPGSSLFCSIISKTGSEQLIPSGVMWSFASGTDSALLYKASVDRLSFGCFFFQRERGKRKVFSLPSNSNT